METTRFPFSATPADLAGSLDEYVDCVFASLRSEFLVLPKGKGYVEYGAFSFAYEVLKRETKSFTQIEADSAWQAVSLSPLSFIVLRSMLGFTPSEWAYVTSQTSSAKVTQGAARTLDRDIRIDPAWGLESRSDLVKERIRAMLETACSLLRAGPDRVDNADIHRLNKADTALGADSIATSATLGIPYAMLLYERYLGRPFASHRDSVSELVGDRLENAIEGLLVRERISHRRTGRAEQLPGFDQAPDFCIPDEHSPRVVIEAKITEDDGTARDKVTRIQHLTELSSQFEPPFQVVACIGGRGFGQRREDMRKLIIATQGKVFTSVMLDHLIDNTDIARYAAQADRLLQ